MDNDEDTYGAVEIPIRLHTAATSGWGSEASAELSHSVPQNVEVIRKIGQYSAFKTRRGGMADVWLCVEDGDELRRPIALKSYRNEYKFDRATRLAFKRECAIWSIAHFAPGVLPLYGIIEIEGRDFIAMAGVLADSRGVTTLADLLRHGSLPLEQVVFQARRMADALARAADLIPDLVHGDLTPNNVLISHGGSWISDFGLARAAGQAPQAKGLRGTRAYCSPLAQNPAAHLTVLDDIYAFGVMLHQMLTGELPRRRRDQRVEPNHEPAEMTQTHTDLLALANRCSAANPDVRPANFRAVLQSLDQISPEAQWPTPGNVSMQLVDETHPKYKRFGNSRLRRAAFSMEKLGEYPTALKCIARIERNSRDWQLLVLQGKSLVALHRLYAALWSYANAYRLAGRESAPQARAAQRLILIRASQAFIANRKYWFAERILRRLVDDDDNDAQEEAAFALGVLYNETGRYSEAVRILRQCQRFADDPNYWNNLGVAHLRLAEGKKAAKAYRRAVELCPDDPGFHSGLGQAHLLTAFGNVTANQVQRALAEFERAIGCGSIDRDVFRYAAICALLSSDKQKLERVCGLIRRQYTEAEAIEIEEEAAVWARSFRNGTPPGWSKAVLMDTQGHRGIMTFQRTR